MIGTLMTISEETFKFFSALEKSLKTVVHGVGGLSHEDWRSFHNDRRTGSVCNTVDGDLVETFLELSASDMDVVLTRLNDELRCRSIDASSPVSKTANISRGTTVDTSASSFQPLTVDEVLRKVEDASRIH